MFVPRFENSFPKLASQNSISPLVLSIGEKESKKREGERQRETERKRGKKFGKKSRLLARSSSTWSIRLSIRPYICPSVCPADHPSVGRLVRSTRARLVRGVADLTEGVVALGWARFHPLSRSLLVSLADL